MSDHHAPTSLVQEQQNAQAQQARLTRLEENVYFQENTLKELNEALTQQQFQMDSLATKLAQIQEKLLDLQHMQDQGAELTVPPHSVQKAF